MELSVNRKNIFSINAGAAVIITVLLFRPAVAQRTAPEGVTGHIHMADGNNIELKSERPRTGHNVFDVSDMPEYIPPANFTRFDAEIEKLYDRVTAVPCLNPPVGFDAKIQINSFHREAKGMYYGWLRIWMFAYYRDWSSKKNIPSEETSSWVQIYVNDPTPLCGNHRYFSDTVQHLRKLADGSILADRINTRAATQVKIIGKPKPLFAPYTTGAFLAAETEYCRQKLIKWKKDLAEDEDKLSEMRAAGQVQVMDQDIRNLKTDISKRRKDLETATGNDKQMILQIIMQEQQQIQILTKTKQDQAPKSQAKANAEFNDALTQTYKAALETDRKKINDLQQQLEQVTDQYNSLSMQQRNAQAFIVPKYESPSQLVYTDEWDADVIRLVKPGQEKGIGLYCYNPDYFNPGRPSDIQLIILTFNAEGNGPVLNKQWEIIQQTNVAQLRSLLQE